MTQMNSFELSMALPTPCQQLPDQNLFGLPVWIKRDDLLHPVVSGNKYRKLKYSLAAIAKKFQQTGIPPTLVTMGGAWSNHVHATAYAAAALGYQSHALIRGHPGMDSTMLAECRERGMQIQFVDRISYRRLREQENYWQSLLNWSTDAITSSPYNAYWLPEGGSTALAVPGVAELIGELPFIPDVMLVACGTAATLAGLLAGLDGRGRVLGIAVLANGDYLRSQVSRLLREGGYPDYQNYQLLTDYHHGGYAKVTPTLREFCSEFINQYQVPIEPVYTGKVFFALHSIIQSGLIQRGESVMVLHTGGLQGARD